MHFGLKTTERINKQIEMLNKGEKVMHQDTGEVMTVEGNNHNLKKVHCIIPRHDSIEDYYADEDKLIPLK